MTVDSKKDVIRHQSTVNGQRSTIFSLWLSWQELNGRRVIFYINVILVALLIALPVSLDLMGNARKSTVKNRVDYIGPSLIMVPSGIMSSDLVAAQFQGRTFSADSRETIQGQYSSYLRFAESRLTERLSVGGRDIPVIGIDFNNVYSHPFRQYSIGSKEILLGNVAADKLEKERGDTLRIQSETFTVVGTIPTTGGIEDASVFLSLSVLQKLADREGRINEIRLFPESLLSYEKLKELLKVDARRTTSDARHATDTLNLIDAYRGDTAEKEIDLALVNYQKTLYTVAFILIALCIMISTYINLDMRKVEVSTVYTLGAKQGIIFQVLTFRTIWITLLGSITGYILSLIITVVRTDNVPIRFIWSTGSFVEVILLTIALGVLVTIPFAFYSVYKRNPIGYL
jgi:ABC-type antimicrobial peptide transport system permease subunit